MTGDEVVFAALGTRLGLRWPTLTVVLQYIEDRLNAELSELKPVTVLPRMKDPESVLHKLQTGRFDSLDEMNDLMGVKVVLLYRHQIGEAQAVLRASDLTVIDVPVRQMMPTDFAFNEPKQMISPPQSYVDRNPDRDLGVEVQFTTALQHALDMATHGFDYKGSTYEWGNFRMVAQLRGTLELVDRILDDLETSQQLIEGPERAPDQFTLAVEMHSALTGAFESDRLPRDLRRMTDTCLSWCEALGISPADLSAFLANHQDLLTASSIDSTSAVLGVLMRERGDLATLYTGNFVVSAELLSLCSECEAVPEDRRVRI